MKPIRRNEHAKMLASNRNDSTNVESIHHCETVYNKHSLRGMRMSMEGEMEVVEEVWGRKCREVSQETPGSIVEVSF